MIADIFHNNLVLTFLLICNDAFLYGYIYEIKHWCKAWLFYEVPFRGHTLVPFYRAEQWSLDGLVLWILYNPTAWHIGSMGEFIVSLWIWICANVTLLATLLAWYAMIKEGGFYIILNQWKNLKKDEESGKDMFWLKRIYFSGKWLFKNGFTVKKFALSIIIGLIILVISNFI